MEKYRESVGQNIQSNPPLYSNMFPPVYTELFLHKKENGKMTHDVSEEDKIENYEERSVRDIQMMKEFGCGCKQN